YTISFISSVVYGSQEDDLSIYVSSHFKGGSDISAVREAQWTEITDRPVLAEAEKFVPSGTVDLSDLVRSGKPFFIAFKYEAPATKAMTQRMWRIHRLQFQHNGEEVGLSDWLFINHTDNEE